MQRPYGKATSEIGFGGNKESKKMQKTILKQNYENFAASSQEGLDKTYDRCMKIDQSKYSSSSNSQNVAFVSYDNSSSTNETVNTTHSISATSSKDQAFPTAIYVDDVIEMLTMRVKRFIKKTGRKMDLNDKETVGFDRTKVECYNCHRRCDFARECRAPKNLGNRNRNSPRRNAPVDTSTTRSLLVDQRCDRMVMIRSLQAD
ncbi:hypothetical protein Tco_1534067 [Tanacetum coccineum]